MIKIADRYIIRQYFTSFLFITLSLLFVMTVFNWIDMNDKYSRKNAELLTILKYYFYNIPYFLNIVVSICALIASLISFSNFSKTNELTALRAAGVSRLRSIFPVLMMSLLISLFLLIFNEAFGVKATLKKTEIYDYEIFKEKKRGKTLFNDVRHLPNNAILQVNEFRTADTLMLKANIQYMTKDLRVKKRIDADSIVWRKNKWLMKGVALREFSLGVDSSFTFRYFQRYELDDLDFKPKDLEAKKFSAGKIERFLTIAEMYDYSRRMALFGQPTFIVDYEIYNAFFFPFSIFFMTFIGALLGSITNRGGSMLYFFICIFICLIYIAIIVLGKIFGQANTIPPFWGALLPHIVTSLGLFVLAFRR